MLGCDDDDAIGSSRTINGCRCGVFQNLYALDVFRADLVSCSTLDAVYYIEWGVVCGDGGSAADSDGDAASRLE